MGNKDSGLYSCGVPQLICLYPTDRLRGSGDSVRECNQCKGDQKGRILAPISDHVPSYVGALILMIQSKGNA